MLSHRFFFLCAMFFVLTLLRNTAIQIIQNKFSHSSLYTENNSRSKEYKCLKYIYYFIRLFQYIKKKNQDNIEEISDTRQYKLIYFLKKQIHNSYILFIKVNSSFCMDINRTDNWKHCQVSIFQNFTCYTRRNLLKNISINIKYFLQKDLKKYILGCLKKIVLFVGLTNKHYLIIQYKKNQLKFVFYSQLKVLY